MEQLLLLKNKINNFLERKVLLSDDILKEIDDKTLEIDWPQDFLILNKENFSLLKEKKEIDWQEFDKQRVLLELGKENNYSDYGLVEKEKVGVEFSGGGRTSILQSYDKKTKKYGVQDFVRYFIHRYKALEKILRNRQELLDVVSINRIIKKTERENVALIGMIVEKNLTSNGNLLLKVEDLTGSIKVLVSKKNPELFEEAKDLVLDEVIGLTGMNGDKIVFTNKLFWPDIPFNKDLKKTPDEVYALVLADIHVGSIDFLPDGFDRFLKWINGEVGNEKQKEMAKKTKYIFICGDLVDGVGIYPSQESELVIKDIYKQYEECANLLKQIPADKQLIICAGNHDALRLAEPQPILAKDFAKPLFDLPNTTFVSNPATVTIHASENFSGLDVLLYHGYSLDYYYTQVDKLRLNKAMDKPHLILKFLLKKRHLAPSHSSTLYIPDAVEDPLVINKIPDLVVTGHIHKPGATNYRNITIVCGSCWQAKTSFQEKVGHEPEPGKIPIINLQTREIKFLNFI
ncbi:metallophosphoesterase [Nanoarchaeota archaeon]